MKFFLNQIKNLPEYPGIYKFYSKTEILLYVGKAKNLKNRVGSYFLKSPKDPKTSQLVSQIHYMEIIPVSSEFEALLLEAGLIKIAQPKYNVIWKDDKHYIYIKITREKFPKVLFARKDDATGDFYGPFPSSAVVREILAYLRTIFPFCTQKENAKRACFYHHLGLCDPCPSEIVKLKKENAKYRVLKAKYRQNIRHIRKILEGKLITIKRHLTGQMILASKQKNYEKAAKFRDRLLQLDYLINNYTPAASYIENPKLLSTLRSKEQNQLISILVPYYKSLFKLDRIECLDISNISGKLATGSLVTFRHGQPDKNLYRRFKIRIKDTPDDFAMLQEVLARRLHHSEWTYPDLFVIDGGKPQLAALKKVFEKRELAVPFIGLAKQEEEIVVPAGNDFIKIRLPENSGALNLVKRVRDEAHRFAHKYHSLLRLKYLLSAVENK